MSEPHNSPRRVLLVEDNPLIVFDLESRLQRLGYDVVGIVGSGREAVSTAVSARPDVVLMDIQLSDDVSGVQAAEAIASRMDVPVIYLSATSDRSTLEKARQTSPYGYLVKPVGDRELETAIELATYKHKADMQVRTMQRNLAALFDSVTDSILGVAADGIVMFANAATQRLLCRSAAELTGQAIETVLKLVDRSDPTRAWNLQEVSALDGPTELAVLDGQGEWRALDVSTAPYLGSPGPGTLAGSDTGAAGLVVVCRDVTETARLRRRQDLIFHFANDCIVSAGPDGYSPVFNLAAFETLGWSRDDVQQGHLHSLLHGEQDHTESSCSLLSVVRSTHTRVSASERFRRRDGSFFTADYTATRIVEYGQTTGVVIIFRDATQRLEVSRMKDEFTSTVSHELMTPLTSMRGSLGLLASGKFNLSEPATRMLTLAVRNSDRLIRLLSDLLDINRLEAGSQGLQLNLCSLPVLAKTALAEVQPMADEHSVSLTSEICEGEVRADRDRLSQVVVNLLGNAIKFSPAHSSVHLRIDQSQTAVSIAVIDQGPGIPRDKLEMIFDKFAQVDGSDARKKGGTGLGLAISKHVVEQHGGRIEVQSAVGQGSTFVVSLPRRDTSVDDSQSEGL